MADRSIVYRLQADISQFRAQMAQAGASVRKAADDMTSATKSGKTWRQGLDQVGKSAGRVGLVAAAGLGAAILKAANFDQAMSKVQAATHETAANMEALRDAAIEAGQRTVYSATESAGAIEELAKAGVSTKDILSGGLNGALDLAAAGTLDVGEAAEFAASAMNQFGLKGSEVPHIADLLAAAAGKAQGEVSDMGQALGNVGTIASQMGLSIEETTGALASFASAGLIGAEAGTAFKSFLLHLNPTTKAAATAMEDIGFNAYDATGKLKPLDQIVGELSTGLQGLSSDQERAAVMQKIFGTYAIQAANILKNQGAQGIQEWIDKVNDSGYAADTASIKLDNLKGDLEQLGGALETALIGTGDGAQGPLRSLVQGLTGVVNAYNKLPGAAQGAVGAMLGVTAAAGGGLWAFSRIVQSVANTRKALDDLGFSAGRAGGALKKLSLAGGAVGVLIGVEQAMSSLARASDEAAPGVEHVTRNLLALNSVKGLSGVASDLGDLRGSIETLADPGLSARVGNLYGKIPVVGQIFADIAPGLRGAQADAREAAASLDALDQSLANIVTAGSPEQAAEAFDQLAKAYGLTADEQDELRDLLPGYKEAIDGAANSATLAAGATKSAAKGMDKLGDAGNKAEKALEASRKAARETAASFFGLGDKVNKAKVSLGGWLRDLEKQADALRNFRINAQKAAKKGLDEGLIASLQAAGPEGALRMRQLANATDTEIARANKAWQRGQKEIERYTDAVGGVPEKATTKVDAQTAAAMSGINAVEYRLNSLPNYKRVTIEVRTVRTGSDGAGGPRETYATGGYVRGPGTATSDSIPAWLSNGEYIVNAAATARHRSTLEAINSHAYAGGGYVGSGSGGSIGGGGKEILALRTELRQINRHLEHIDRSLPDRLADANVSALNYSTASRARRP